MLADVYAVRAAGHGDLHVVVDEKRHAVFHAQRFHFEGFLQEGFLLQFLFPQLDAGRASADGGFRLPEQR